MDWRRGCGRHPASVRAGTAFSPAPVHLLARRFGRHCNANLIEIRIIPKCIRLWLQRLLRPLLAISAQVAGGCPMDGGGRGKSGERSCYFPVINRTRCVDDVRAAGKLGPRPVTFLAAAMLSRIWSRAPRCGQQSPAAPIAWRSRSGMLSPLMNLRVGGHP